MMGKKKGFFDLSEKDLMRMSDEEIEKLKKETGDEGEFEDEG